MRTALTRTRLIAAVCALALLATGAIMAATRGAAVATEPEPTPFQSYGAPSGPELSPQAIAQTAVQEARAFGEQGQVTVEVGRGTHTQALALMEGKTIKAAASKERQLAASKPPATFCFGGENAPCTASEPQHAKEVLRAIGRASTYLVTVLGQQFTPPEHLRKGEAPIVGAKVVMVFDAHTGQREGLVIGKTPKANLGELPSGASAFTSAAASSQVAAAYTHPPRAKYGSVAGTFTRQGEAVVFSDRTVFGRTRVRHGRFLIAAVYRGRYRIAGRLRSGRYCPSRPITVRIGAESIAHLTC